MKRFILASLLALILPSTNADAQFSIGEISILKSLSNRACSDGQVPTWVAATQRWTCGSGGGGGGTGDIDSVTAGVGLTGGGTSGAVTINLDVPVTVARGGTGSTTASGARTNLGLGTISTQNSSLVSITGGSITGITPIAIADGGTGSATSSAARTALGVAIGVDVQAFNSNLTGLAALASTGFVTRTASSTFANRTLTGTANQITVTNGDGVSGNPTLSIPTNPTLPGNTTGTFTGNLTGNATTATLASALDTYIPPPTLVANLPALPVNGQTVTITNGLSAGSCETGGGVAHTLCQWNAATNHWEPAVPIGGSATLQTAFNAGRSITGAVDSTTDVQIFGAGTQCWRIGVDSSEEAYFRTCLASDWIARGSAAKQIIIQDASLNPLMQWDNDTGNLTRLFKGTQTAADIAYYDGTKWVRRPIVGAAFGSENGGSNITCSGGGGDTTYLTVFGSTLSTTESLVRHPSSVVGALGNLYVAVPSAVPAGQTVTVTAMVAGSASTSTCAVAAAGTACNDTTHTPAVAVGDSLSLRINCAGGVTAIATLRAGFSVR